MGLTAIDPAKYGELLAKELPRPIQNDEELQSMADRLEALYFPERQLTPEEDALAKILSSLIETYDEEHHPMPDVPPNEMVRYLMEQRNLKQADLIRVLGTRAQVSDAVTGRRGISKAQAKKLAGFFHVPADVFL